MDKENLVRGLSPEDRPRVEQAMEAAFQPGSGGHFAVDCSVVGSADCKERWILARGRVFFDTKGSPMRFLAWENTRRRNSSA